MSCTCGKCGACRRDLIAYAKSGAPVIETSVDDVVFESVAAAMLSAMAKCAAIADGVAASSGPETQGGRLAARMIAAKIREEAGKLKGRG